MPWRGWREVPRTLAWRRLAAALGWQFTPVGESFASQPDVDGGLLRVPFLDRATRLAFRNVAHARCDLGELVVADLAFELQRLRHTHYATLAALRVPGRALPRFEARIAHPALTLEGFVDEQALSRLVELDGTLVTAGGGDWIAIVRVDCRVPIAELATFAGVARWFGRTIAWRPNPCGLRPSA